MNNPKEQCPYFDVFSPENQAASKNQRPVFNKSSFKLCEQIQHLKKYIRISALAGKVLAFSVLN